jgi:thioredoxin 1
MDIRTIKSIKSMQDFSNVIYNTDNLPVVIDFTASWCGPCRTIAPSFLKVSQMENAKGIIFAKVDVDDAQDVAEQCNVSSMPTFIAFYKGVKVMQFSGANLKKLEDMVNHCLTLDF